VIRPYCGDILGQMGRRGGHPPLRHGTRGRTSQLLLPALVPSLPTRRTRNPATLGGGSQTSHKPNPCTQPGTQPSTHYRHATRSYPARLMTTTTATPFPSTPTTPLAFIASAAIAFYPPRQNAALLPVPLLLLCLTTRHRPAIITLLSASRPHQ